MQRTAWIIDILPSARRELLAFRNPIQNRIRTAIRTLANDPNPPDSIAMGAKVLDYTAYASELVALSIGFKTSGFEYW